MFANLLAASLASNRGRVGCTRTDWLIYAGLAVPNGSSPEFTRPFACVCDGDWIIGDDADCANGCTCGCGDGMPEIDWSFA